MRVGRRGAFLVLFGAVYVLLGYSYLSVTVTPAVRHSLKLALSVAPLEVYAWGWIVAGAVAIVAGVMLPVAWKAAGFAAAVVMPTIWALVALTAWTDGHVARAWVTAVVYALLAGSVAVVAGMVDPGDLEAHR